MSAFALQDAPLGIARYFVTSPIWKRLGQPRRARAAWRGNPEEGRQHHQATPTHNARGRTDRRRGRARARRESVTHSPRPPPPTPTALHLTNLSSPGSRVVGVRLRRRPRRPHRCGRRRRRAALSLSLSLSVPPATQRNRERDWMDDLLLFFLIFLLLSFHLRPIRWFRWHRRNNWCSFPITLVTAPSPP